MKTIMLCMVLFLSGCSIISLPTYHETEYAQFIDIADLSSRGSCDPLVTQRLSYLSNRAALYSTFLPHNELMAKGAVEMDAAIVTLNKRAHTATTDPTLSEAYCRLKLSLITSMSQTLAEAAGGKTR